MENALYMLKTVTGSQMNSFIITTESGGLIVIDGGMKGDKDNLLLRLREISGRDVPHIDAWFLSHAHCDHIDAFMQIMEKHRDEIELDKVYYNFPSVQFFDKYESWEAHTDAEFIALLPSFASCVCPVTQGDSYDIGGAVFDILYSPEPDFTMNAVNNSSIVIRMTLGEKTVMFLGDLGIQAGNKLLAMHGDKLKSDYCQMAHHGQSGVTREVYDAIAPRGCIWCTPLWLWNNDAGKGYNTHSWQTIIVRGWMDEMGIKEHYVLKDGEQKIVM